MEKAGGLRSNMAAGAWAVIVILASPVMLLAQVTGTMSGYVKDSSGSVVPQAKVTATLVQRGTAFVAETNAEGFYKGRGAVRVGEKASNVHPDRMLPLMQYRLRR